MKRPRRLDCPAAGPIVELLEKLEDGYARIRTTTGKRTVFETLTSRLHKLNP